jgi:4-alpha-glucanotransferase
MINAISSSEANTVIIPIQDILGLAGDHRMNYPGQYSDNWEWRFSWEQVRQEYTDALAKLSKKFGRKPPLQTLATA